MIYFDYAATTPPTKEIMALHEKISKEYWYNCNSAHQMGIMCDQLLQKASNVIKNTLHLKKKKIVYTSSATTANNLAIYGICNSYLGQNKHIITTKIEHPSVLNCYKDLETKGFKVTYLDVNSEGFIDPEDIINAISSDTILISIMWVNNIIGAIQPINEVIKVVKRYPRLKLHVDGVGGVGKIAPDFDFNDIDLLTYTAHKLEGIKGTGVLIYQENISLNSNVKGGHQQEGNMPGTVDLAGAVCFAKTTQEAVKNLSENYEIVSKYHDELVNAFKGIPHFIINSPMHDYSPYLFNLSIMGLKGETIMHSLEQNEIYVSTTSACNATSKTLDKTLMAMTNDETRTIDAIRISLSHLNTLSDITTLIETIKMITEKYLKKEQQ